MTRIFFVLVIEDGGFGFFWHLGGPRPAIKRFNMGIHGTGPFGPNPGQEPFWSQMQRPFIEEENIRYFPFSSYYSILPQTRPSQVLRALIEEENVRYLAFSYY